MRGLAGLACASPLVYLLQMPSYVILLLADFNYPSIALAMQLCQHVVPLGATT